MKLISPSQVCCTVMVIDEWSPCPCLNPWANITAVAAHLNHWAKEEGVHSCSTGNMAFSSRRAHGRHFTRKVRYSSWEGSSVGKKPAFLLAFFDWYSKQNTCFVQEPWRVVKAPGHRIDSYTWMENLLQFIGQAWMIQASCFSWRAKFSACCFLAQHARQCTKLRNREPEYSGLPWKHSD